MEARDVVQRLKHRLYAWRTGYAPTCERVNPDFPDENFKNHLKVYRFFEQFVAGKQVLDVGCGTGYGTALLAERAASIVGIDLSDEALRWARQRYTGVRYVTMDAQHLEFPDRSFDVVVSSENFEHLPDQAAHVLELARVLRPDGLCVVGTPNPEMFLHSSNPFHTKENSYEELQQLFCRSFHDVTILENLDEPPTTEGRAMREHRFRAGLHGPAVPAWIDTASLHNTHSFVCLLRQPASAQSD